MSSYTPVVRELLTTYNTVAVRELLMAAFNDEEFTMFCFDHARLVQQQFTSGQPLGARVQLLVEYAVRHGRLEAMLRAVEEANPYQFSAFRSQFHSVRCSMRMCAMCKDTAWEWHVQMLIA